MAAETLASDLVTLDNLLPIVDMTIQHAYQVETERASRLQKKRKAFCGLAESTGTVVDDMLTSDRNVTVRMWDNLAYSDGASELIESVKTGRAIVLDLDLNPEVCSAAVSNVQTIPTHNMVAYAHVNKIGYLEDVGWVLPPDNPHSEEWKVVRGEELVEVIAAHELAKTDKSFAALKTFCKELNVDPRLLHFGADSFTDITQDSSKLVIVTNSILQRAISKLDTSTPVSVVERLNLGIGEKIDLKEIIGFRPDLGWFAGDYQRNLKFAGDNSFESLIDLLKVKTLSDRQPQFWSLASELLALKQNKRVTGWPSGRVWEQAEMLGVPTNALDPVIAETSSGLTITKV